MDSEIKTARVSSTYGNTHQPLTHNSPFPHESALQAAVFHSYSLIKLQHASSLSNGSCKFCIALTHRSLFSHRENVHRKAIHLDLFTVKFSQTTEAATPLGLENWHWETRPTSLTGAGSTFWRGEACAPCCPVGSVQLRWGSEGCLDCASSGGLFYLYEKKFADTEPMIDILQIQPRSMLGKVIRSPKSDNLDFRDWNIGECEVFGRASHVRWMKLLRWNLLDSQEVEFRKLGKQEAGIWNVVSTFPPDSFRICVFLFRNSCPPVLDFLSPSFWNFWLPVQNSCLPVFEFLPPSFRIPATQFLTFCAQFRKFLLPVSEISAFLFGIPTSPFPKLLSSCFWSCASQFQNSLIPGSCFSASRFLKFLPSASQLLPSSFQYPVSRVTQ